LAAVLILLAWLARPAGEFWSIPNDYTATSLGVALNVQHWIEAGHRDVSTFENFHYTVPLHLASWGALRLAAPAGEAPVTAALRDPTSFALWNRRFTFLITVCGAVAVSWLARGCTVPCMALAILSFFTADPARTYGLLLLGNESFALLGAAVFFGAAFATLERRSATAWLVQGVLAGAALYLKLNYLAWGLGGFVCLAWLWWRRTPRRADVRNHFLAYAAGMSIGVVLIGWLFFGLTGLEQLLRTHAGIFLHTGRYGSGETGVVNVRQALINVAWIIRSPNLWLASAVCGIAALWTMRLRLRDKPWLDEAAPIVVWILSSTALIALAAIKHWDNHYLLPATAILPVFIVWLERWSSPGTQRLVALCVVALLVRAAIVSVAENHDRVAVSAADARDGARIAALPLSGGEFRLWSWRTGGPTSLVLTAEWDSATKGAYRETLRQVLPNDRLYNIWSGEVDPVLGGKGRPPAATQWKYAAFAKGVYPTKETLPEYFQRCGEILTDRGFEMLLVVERSASCPAVTKGP
jgi:hypothetical protein